MRNQQLVNELPGLLLTGARYFIAENIAQRIKEDKPINLHMGIFIAADILDGAILRKFNADTPIRRVADGVIDHISVARVATEIAKRYPESRPYIKILASRAIAVGGLNVVHLLKTGEVTKGQKNQKLTNLATAAFALTAVHGNEKATHIAGSVASAIAALTSLPHFNEIGEQHPEGIRKL